MKVGLLYMEENKEKVEEELKSGKATIGTSVEELFNALNFYEIKHEGNHTKALMDLKKDLMVITGRLVLEDPEEKGAADDGSKE